MGAVLQQLYDGRIFPAEQYRPFLEEYRKLRQEHYKHYEDFIFELKELDNTLSKRFIDIMDEQLDLFPYDTSSMFIDGFRLGARMMLEILDDKYKSD